MQSFESFRGHGGRLALQVPSSLSQIFAACLYQSIPLQHIAAEESATPHLQSLNLGQKDFCANLFGCKIQRNYKVFAAKNCLAKNLCPRGFGCKMQRVYKGFAATKMAGNILRANFVGCRIQRKHKGFAANKIFRRKCFAQKK